MTTYFLVNVLALVPLGALGLWLDHAKQRFAPAREDDDVMSRSVDMMVRRLAEDLAKSQRDSAHRRDTYARVVESLRPAIRRRLARTTLTTPARMRLEALVRPTGASQVRTPAQLTQLLTDLDDTT